MELQAQTKWSPSNGFQRSIKVFHGVTPPFSLTKQIVGRPVSLIAIPQAHTRRIDLKERRKARLL